MVETRTSNNNKHPGLVDAPAPRRTPAQVQAEKRADQEMKAAAAAEKRANILAVAQTEVAIRGNEVSERAVAARPPVSKTVKAHPVAKKVDADQEWEDYVAPMNGQGQGSSRGQGNGRGRGRGRGHGKGVGHPLKEVEAPETLEELLFFPEIRDGDKSSSDMEDDPKICTDQNHPTGQQSQAMEIDVDSEVEITPAIPKGSKGKESIRKQIDAQIESQKRKASSEIPRPVPKRTKASKLSGIAPKWSSSTHSVASGSTVTSGETTEADDSLIGVGLFTDEDHACERDALEGTNARKTTQLSVKIVHNTKPPVPTSRGNIKSKPKSFKMQDLESFYQSQWTSAFLPTYIMRVGSDPSPWSPTFDAVKTIQEIRDEIYVDSEHVIDKEGAVFHIAQQRVSEWRNLFGSKAVLIVSKWFGDEQLFPTSKHVAARVKYLFGKDSPWLWKNGLDPPLEGKIFVKTGYLQSPFILEVFAEHFNVTGINMDPTLLETLPNGTLALALSALERALHAFETGSFFMPEGPPGFFSKSVWGMNTKKYVTIIKTVAARRWTDILAGTLIFTTFSPDDSTGALPDDEFVAPESDPILGLEE